MIFTSLRGAKIDCVGYAPLNRHANYLLTADRWMRVGHTLNKPPEGVSDGDMTTFQAISLELPHAALSYLRKNAHRLTADLGFRPENLVLSELLESLVSGLRRLTAPASNANSVFP